MSISNAKIKWTLIYNTSSNLLKFFVSIIITFIMTPVILHALGNHDYGIWEIIISITGYLGLLDIGLRPTIARFIARVSPEKNLIEWREIYSTSFFLMLAVAFVIGSVFMAWSFFDPGGLAENANQHFRYALFLQFVSAQVFISFLYYHLESILEGGQRYVLKNNVDLIDSMICAIIVYNLINRFDPLLFLCVVNISSAFVKISIFNILLPPKGLSKFPSISRFNFNLVKQLYSFGYKSFFQNASTSIEKRTDVIIVGSFINPASVAFYSIPQALITRISGLISTFTHALMPAFSQLDANSQSDLIKKIFLGGSRMAVAIIGLFSMGAVALGAPFISLWVGKEYAIQAEIIVYILTAYLFVGMLVPLGNRYMTAIGRHGVLAKMYTARAIINLLVSLLLVKPMGMTGVALGSMVGALIVFPFESRAILSCLKIGLLQYLKVTLLPILLPAAGMGTCAVVGNILKWTENWTGFLLTGLLSCCAYLLIYLIFSISVEDRTRLLNLRNRMT